MTSSASLRRGLMALWCLVVAGCAGVTNELTEDAITTVAPAGAVTTPATADVAVTSEPASAPPVATLAGSTENSIDEPPVATAPEPAPPSTPTADVPPQAAELAVVAPAAPATELEAAPARISSAVASTMAAEMLDFSSLVSRLRKTKAISLLTKVAVKNESEDLLEEFRAYHAQHGIVTLGELRHSYDLLFHKLHSLLEDADPPLARDIDRSRAAIWEFLADPRKFGASHLMAGA